MDILAFSILFLFSFVGFIAIFFTSIGTLIIVIGIFLFGVLTEFQILSITSLVIILILYFIGELVEFICVIVGAKKMGASKAGIVGAIVGGFVGSILGAALFGVGVFLGGVLGLFLGAFLFEVIVHGNMIRSLKAGAGSVIGRFGAILVKLLITAGMFWIVIARSLDFFRS